MSFSSTRISRVSFDSAARRYVGDVTFTGPEGLIQLRVSAPGLPGWGYERTLEALTEAAHRARKASRR